MPVKHLFYFTVTPYTVSHLGQCAALLVDLRGRKVWISANSPTAKPMASSTGPYSTSTARLLNTLHYRSPMGKVRQNRVVKIDVDCGLHMFVTTPLPTFIDSPVNKCRVVATGHSTYWIVSLSLWASCWLWGPGAHDGVRRRGDREQV